MKKVFLLAVATVAMTIISSCGENKPVAPPVDETIKVESVSLDESALTLIEGQIITLMATVLPEDATNKAIKWSSDNDDIATVKDGEVMAVAAGEATITVTTEDGGFIDDCVITVEIEEIPAERVEMSQSTASLIEGDMLTLTATVFPEEATNQTVTWSSDSVAATVADGVVTAVSAGEATITVTTEDGGHTDVCVVTVKEDWLGAVSFRTDQTWTVDGYIWSDGVMAERCRKADFNPGTHDKAPWGLDCMQNLGLYGMGDPENPEYADWFSWKVVELYGEQLCPEDWRVPTYEDYNYLISKWGAGNFMLPQEYTNEWGLQLGGYVFYMNQEGYEPLQMLNQGLYGEYWTSTPVENTTDAVYAFRPGSYGVLIESYTGLNCGLTVRCVKDAE